MDCFGHPAYCRSCCLKVHHLHPYHVIQKWNGTCFVQSSLYDAGLVLHLGHNGSPCPTFKRDKGTPEMTPSRAASLSLEGDSDLDDDKEDVICVVHTSGIFQSRIRYCSCINAAQRYVQLLNLHLFPASIVSPKTAFTFAVLDHFEIDAMECKTSAMSFMSKLKRLTSDPFPHTVPVSLFSSVILVKLTADVRIGSLP
jgi:hypothetical protein